MANIRSKPGRVYLGLDAMHGHSRHHAPSTAMPTRIGGNDGLHSHIPIVQFLGELLFDVPNSGGRLLCALLPSMQATQLRCGGFIVALRLDRTVADGVRALGNAQPSPHHMHLP